MAGPRRLGGQPPRGASATTVLGVVGAVLVVTAIAVGVVLLMRDGGPTSQAGQRTPAPSPSGQPGATPSAPASPQGDTDGPATGDDGPEATDGGEVATLPAEAPATAFAIGPGGVQRVDAATGDRAVMEATEVAEDAVSFPVGVDVWPGGGRLAVDLCCEPVPGSTYTLAAGDSADGLSLLHSGGIHPAVDPDGRRVAMAARGPGGSAIVIVDRAGERVHTITGSGAAPDVGELAWSPDGDRLAFEWGAEHAGVWAVAVDATDLADADEVARRAGVVFESPAFRADGMLVVARSDPPALRNFDEPGAPPGTSTGLVLDPATGEQRASFAYDGRVLHQDYDASGTYLLYSLGDGRVRWRGAGAGGELAPAGSRLSAVAW